MASESAPPKKTFTGEPEKRRFGSTKSIKTQKEVLISEPLFVVGLPGFEPGKAGPESAVLPLHHSPKLNCDAKVHLFFVNQTIFVFFCEKK